MSDGGIVGEARGGIVPMDSAAARDQWEGGDPMDGIRARAKAANNSSGFAIEALGLDVPCRAATLDAFVTAARSLKAAEEALIAARTAYAEAVKALSEEAVR